MKSLFFLLGTFLLSVPLYAEQAAPRRLLVFSATAYYRHPELPRINGWLVREGAKQGFEVDVTENGKDFKPSSLANYSVLVLNNANKLAEVLSEQQMKWVEEWYAEGGGIVALHATLVRQEGWPWLQEIGGCDFDSDSEFLRARIKVDPGARDHPAVKGAPAEFWYEADWTNHTRPVTGLPGFQVLLRVDESSYDPVRAYFKERNGKAMGADHPIAWTSRMGKGRFFYTELGHDLRSLDTDFGRMHVFEGVKWAMGKD